MKTDSVRIIGIDCAADPRNVGLAMGEYAGGQARLQEVAAGKDEDGVLTQIIDWMAPASTALLALDAPLGWPEPMGRLLSAHWAGEPIEVEDRKVEANDLFRRTTDKWVKQNLHHQPLDVGADRIARTALGALRLLGTIRKRTRLSVPLAWMPGDLIQAQAIEVYPAGTLKAHDWPDSGYKEPAQTTVRTKIIRGLERCMTMTCDVGMMRQDADVLDAAVCVLAGVDFLNGTASPPPPEGLEQVKKEGWIWVAKGA
jgi:hypothetical protein